MSIEINRIKWKCRRGMRELDLLLREFAAENLEKLDETNLKILDEVLDYDDQSLFDYIFKNISLSNYEHEDFIDKFLKKFSKMGNFQIFRCVKCPFSRRVGFLSSCPIIPKLFPASSQMFGDAF